MKNKYNTEDQLAADSVHERVYLAVEHLCIGERDVRGRLITAIYYLFPLREKEFPSELRNDFKWIMKESTKFQSAYPQIRGDIEETMRRIQNRTGKKIAKRIFHVFSEIQRIRGYPLSGLP